MSPMSFYFSPAHSLFFLLFALTLRLARGDTGPPESTYSPHGSRGLSPSRNTLPPLPLCLGVRISLVVLFSSCSASVQVHGAYGAGDVGHMEFVDNVCPVRFDGFFADAQAFGGFSGGEPEGGTAQDVHFAR